MNWLKHFKGSDNNNVTFDSSASVLAQKSWGNHYREIQNQARVWQLVGLFSLFVLLLTISIALYIGGQSKFIPYVVEVDTIGNVKTQIFNVENGIKPDIKNRVIRNLLSEWIKDIRFVTVDKVLQRNGMVSVYAYIAQGDPAFTKVNRFFDSDQNPLIRAENNLVMVEIVSVLQQTPETWQIDWIETIFTRSGEVIDSIPWKAIITVYEAQSFEPSEKELRMNPLGLYIKDFSWSRAE